MRRLVALVAVALAALPAAAQAAAPPPWRAAGDVRDALFAVSLLFGRALDTNH